MPLTRAEHHLLEQLPPQTHRQQISPPALPGNSGVFHRATPQASTCNSPVLLRHILVVDVPTDVPVRGTDALATDVLRALQKHEETALVSEQMEQFWAVGKDRTFSERDDFVPHP